MGSDNFRKALVAAFIIVLIAYLINFGLAIYHFESMGTFGDSFGAANAAFSGIALFMLIWAVLLQREELKIVKDERKDTREILSGQAALTRLQQSALERQNFEQSFFSLLGFASQERRALDAPFGPGSAQTVINVASSEAVRELRRRMAADGFVEIPNEIPENVRPCERLCRIFVTAVQMLETHGYDRPEADVCASSLHALLDSEFAHCWALISLAWVRDRPRAVEAFLFVAAEVFLEPEFRDWTKHQLGMAQNGIEESA